MTEENHPAPDAKTRRFATGYKRTTGEIFVYGALFIAILSLGWALVFGNPYNLIAVPMALLCAGYFYPLLDTHHVQLGADERGLYVGGLGLIDWNNVENIELIRVPVRRVERAELRATLKRALEECVLVPDEVPWWRQFMAKNWSLNRAGQLIVRLEQLKATPQTVQDDMLPFWPER